MAGNLVELAHQRGVPLFNRETQGSLENIRKLADPKENAALGFAQSDLLAWLRQSVDPVDRQAAASLRLVLPLYAEEVHVLARTGLNTLADLAGQRVLTAANELRRQSSVYLLGERSGELLHKISNHCGACLNALDGVQKHLHAGRHDQLGEGVRIAPSALRNTCATSSSASDPGCATRPPPSLPACAKPWPTRWRRRAATPRRRTS